MSIDIIALQQEFKEKTKIDIKYEVLEKLVTSKGYDIVEKYINNWDKFKHQTIKNILGFFIVAVMQEFDIPVEQKGKATYVDFEQRNYTEEELNKVYANFLNDN